MGLQVIMDNLTPRDLHQGNVLITTRYYEADLATPERSRAVLIDFGRGKWIHESAAGQQKISWRGNSEAIRQDIYDYGCLIKDLAQQWMGRTGHTTLPVILLDVIEACTDSEAQTNMRDILYIWDAHNPREDVVYIYADQAWDSLRDLNDSVYAATRSRPAVPSDPLRPRFISAENLD